ncbi:hypothetical protein Zmor_012411 [Zophobas morio]|jgi:hypothetical protein|uniref:BZIP domain-containing protein n=1 Tax=Zophobas morio TaxID=2755281 RepID=A0AA38HHU4_9CUCU|nr:hypothetical protein Zmor_012411 [Zophobas morio]
MQTTRASENDIFKKRDNIAMSVSSMIQSSKKVVPTSNGKHLDLYQKVPGKYIDDNFSTCCFRAKTTTEDEPHSTFSTEPRCYDNSVLKNYFLPYTPKSYYFRAPNSVPPQTRRKYCHDPHDYEHSCTQKKLNVSNCEIPCPSVKLELEDKKHQMHQDSVCFSSKKIPQVSSDIELGNTSSHSFPTSSKIKSLYTSESPVCHNPEAHPKINTPENTCPHICKQLVYVTQTEDHEQTPSNDIPWPAEHVEQNTHEAYNCPAFAQYKSYRNSDPYTTVYNEATLQLRRSISAEQYRKKRAQNNAAAKKCRLKAKSRLQEIINKNEQLVKENFNLKKRNEELEQLNRRLLKGVLIDTDKSVLDGPALIVKSEAERL